MSISILQFMGSWLVGVISKVNVASNKSCVTQYIKATDEFAVLSKRMPSAKNAAPIVKELYILSLVASDVINRYLSDHQIALGVTLETFASICSKLSDGEAVQMNDIKAALTQESIDIIARWIRLRDAAADLNDVCEDALGMVDNHTAIKDVSTCFEALNAPGGKLHGLFPTFEKYQQAFHTVH